ncbi:MAG: hypothetical protein IIA45_02800, partial [Bacteroidetes bacterium]|nr:hypothetical protein [Bacteroidota bacterium]
LSPALFGFPRFKGKNPFNDREMFWNFNVLHNFVGFGTTIDVMFFFKQDDWNLFFTWHNFENRFNYFPGFDLEIMRYPLEKLFVSGTIGLWLQPEDQLFQTTKSEPGGIIKLGIDVPFWGDFEWSLFSEFKSYGYVSGITPLQPAVQFHTGINWRY